jgi:hypothetical protein
VKLEGADAIQELQRVALQLQSVPAKQPEIPSIRPSSKARQKKTTAAA